MYFTIIIPCYNSAKTLHRALDAVLAQQDHVKEIILVDDGSTDETAEIAKQYLHQHPHLIQCHQQSNQGSAMARNKGIALARGRYTLFLDSDDAIRDNALATFHDAFQQSPDVNLLIAGYCNIHGTQKTIRLMKPCDNKMDMLKTFWFGKFSTVSAVMPMRTSVLQHIQYPNIRHGEDVVFISHLISAHEARVLDFVSMDVYHSPTSLRHQTQSIMQQQDAIVPLLFNPAYLIPEAMSYQQQYHARKLISLARTANESQQKDMARTLLKKAFHMYPASFLRWKTLKILFRTWEPANARTAH